MSLRAFNESLYREHFDELASLSEIRSAWLRDAESGPDDVAGIEERIEAHLDALALGGEPALGVAEQEVRPGQPWTLHAWGALERHMGQPGVPRGASHRVGRYCGPVGRGR